MPDLDWSDYERSGVDAQEASEHQALVAKVKAAQEAGTVRTESDGYVRARLNEAGSDWVQLPYMNNPAECDGVTTVCEDSACQGSWRWDWDLAARLDVPIDLGSDYAYYLISGGHRTAS